MSGEIESVGEAVTGGLIARAVEPRAGEPAGAESRQCLNCGATLLGPYCHQCGQKGRVHRRLKDIGHDIAHSVLHLDGKIWRTLPLLFFKPGQLTRRYIEGERARFVSPMALFLFSVFMMFAVFTAVGGPFAVDTPDMADAEAQADFDAEKREFSERLAELAEQKRAREAEGLPTDRIDAKSPTCGAGFRRSTHSADCWGPRTPRGRLRRRRKRPEPLRPRTREDRSIRTGIQKRGPCRCRIRTIRISGSSASKPAGRALMPRSGKRMKIRG